MLKIWRLLFKRPDKPLEELRWIERWLVELKYIAFVFILTYFVIQPFVIASYDTPTGSMEPTIMTNTRYLAFPSVYGGFVRFTGIKLPAFKQIQRGDIVIFKYPLDETKNFVKRTIGLPGDQVEIIAKTVYINGKPLSEPYSIFGADFLRPNYGPVVVPKDHLFVMGDNRDQSYDSRYWGFVPIKNVYGTPLLSFWSYDREKHRVRTKKMFKLIK